VKRFWFFLKSSTIIILLIAIIAFLSVHYINKYAGDQFSGRVDNYLDHVGRQFKIKALYDKAGYNFVKPPFIEGLEFKSSSSSSLFSSVNIPKITFDYELKIYPSLHVYLKQVVLHDANIDLKLGSQAVTPQEDVLASKGKELVSDILQKTASLNDELSEKNITLAEDFFVSWENATINFVNQKHSFNAVSGKAIYDPLQKKISLKVKQQDISEQELFIELKKDNDQYYAIFEGQNIKIDFLRPYLPGFVHVTEKTRIDALVSVLPLNFKENNIIDLDVVIKDFSINHWRLSEESLSHLDGRLRGVVQLNLPQKKVSFQKFAISRQGVVIGVEGFVDYHEDFIFDLHIDLPRVAIHDVLAAIPQEFIPVIYDAQVGGDIEFRLHAALDVTKPKELVFEPEITIHNYKLVQEPQAAPIKKLRRQFLHKAYKGDEFVKEFKVGSSHRRFVSFRRLGDMIQKGVRTCEDGRFFKHNGFQLKHIKESIIQNLREKRFARGASTISMQTVKNLFLTGKKNLSRKFQEMLLTYAMEQELSKKRILEIYMNIIEWGPKIYGIGHATAHYFNKKPSELTAVEAAFLGSVIANPNKYYYMYKRGEITNTWAQYLKVIVRKMRVAEEDMPQFVSFHNEGKKKKKKKKEAPEPNLFMNNELELYKPEFGWVRKKREAAGNELARKN
jgi:hypothetical protein